MGQFKPAQPLLHGSGKGAFLMPEQFGFQQGFRQRRTAHFYEGLFTARAVSMNGIRNHFLPRSAFTENQHRGIRGGDQFDFFQNLPHLLVFADHTVEIEFSFEFLAKGRILLPQRLDLGRSIHRLVIIHPWKTAW